MAQYDILATEKQNEKTAHIDEMSTLDMVQLFNEEDKLVALAVEKTLPAIASAIDAIAASLSSGGRLFYVGAGTSGRLGVLDASECPPTYGVSYDTVQGVMVGGERAITHAVEGAEDDPEAGIRELIARNFCENDVLVGLSASGHAPSVVHAMEWAHSLGAKTIGISTNPGTPLPEKADIAITPVVGPEVINGSTRMKSGTAQKMVLNMLSTGAMVKTGHVWRNYMVCMRPTNAKLRRRAERIIREATGCDDNTAAKLLIDNGDSIRTAIESYERDHKSHL
ncbi:MAG: N-acetylmuramic acid 6-phosphate etherase [Clostridiaceae bacterium]|nr:N-acetylmuramic acid 6-phosphate etherase [Clostridiaceae bacterium]